MLVRGLSDIDECKVNNGGCHSKRECYNTKGSRLCSKCLRPGWTEDGETGCTGLCLVNRYIDYMLHGPAFGSHNFVASTSCVMFSCNVGAVLMYMLVLSDVDECQKDNGGCHSKRNCTNTMGSHECGACKRGWMIDGEKACKGLLLTGRLTEYVLH